MMFACSSGKNRRFFHLSVNSSVFFLLRFVVTGRKQNQVGVPKVKVRVENSSLAGEAKSILLDPIDFLRGFSVLKDELVRLAAKYRQHPLTAREHHQHHYRHYQHQHPPV